MICGRDSHQFPFRQQIETFSQTIDTTHEAGINLLILTLDKKANKHISCQTIPLTLFLSNYSGMRMTAMEEQLSDRI